MPIKRKKALRPQIRRPIIKDDDLHWFGGKPPSVASNMRWAAAVKRDSLKNPQFILNRVPVFPIKGVKRIVGPSILQNLNSSLDLNPFPISQAQEAEDEKAFTEKQTGARRVRRPGPVRKAKRPQVGGRKTTAKRITKRK